MISLAVAVMFSNLRPTFETVTIPVDQDVWVYPHASDPGGDPALRAWGVGGKAVAATAADAEEFSYGYLRFSFSGIPDGKKLVGATMVFKPVGNPEINPDASKWPLEVRSLVGTFTEKDWDYSQVGKIYPSGDIFGTGILAKADDGDGLQIKVDLLGKDSKFSSAFDKAVKDKQPMHFALTSKYDVSELGQKGVYKVYSKDNKDEAVRPKIVLKFE